jgi:hypothetical protein
MFLGMRAGGNQRRSFQDSMEGCGAGNNSAGELAILQFVDEYNQQKWSEAELVDNFAKLMQVHLAEQEIVADIALVSESAKSFVTFPGFRKRLDSASFLRALMKEYIKSGRDRQERAAKTEGNTLCMPFLETCGTHVDVTDSSNARSVIPDGNVVVVTVGLVLIAAMIVFRPNK